MRLALVPLLGILLLPACATQPPLASAVPPAPRITATANQASHTSQVDVTREVAHLKAALLREVPHLTPDMPGQEAAWLKRAKAAIAAAGYPVEQPQLLVVADRSPSVQQMRLVLALPDEPWQVIGGAKVSTGQAGRRGYFITPVGVFLHTDAILDYRAWHVQRESHPRSRPEGHARVGLWLAGG
jgi:hypothetical protein